MSQPNVFEFASRVSSKDCLPVPRRLLVLLSEWYNSPTLRAAKDNSPLYVLRLGALGVLDVVAASAGVDMESSQVDLDGEFRLAIREEIRLLDTGDILALARLLQKYFPIYDSSLETIE